MAIYNPPTEDLPIFDSSVFESNNAGLTIGEGDARYLRFPISQGSETISGDLTANRLTILGVTDLQFSSTIDGATFTNINPQYKINYPVNSGRFDFFANTAGGVSTRGCKIDATGVHTISKYDTIDETAGTLDIGNLAGRTGAINIGTGTTGTGKTITINGLATNNTTTINGGGINILGSGGQTTSITNTGILNIQNGSSSAINIGSSKTGGTIDIGQSGATASTTVIGIGNGSNQSGAINIGTGASVAKAITIGNVSGAFGTLNLGCASISIANASNTTALNLGTGMTSGAVILGGTTGGTSTLTVNRPIAPAYVPSAIGATNIGHLATPASSNLTAITTANGNLADFSLGVGVWDVIVRVRITAVTATASNYFRLSLLITSATQSTYMNDWMADNATGAVNFLVQGRFSLSATTTIYVVGIAGGGVAASTTSNADVQALRIA